MTDNDFKFELGDLVVHRGEAAGFRVSHSRVRFGTKPMVLVVCERVWQECPGGVQLSYVVSGGAVKVNILEIALEAFDPAEFRSLTRDEYPWTSTDKKNRVELAGNEKGKTDG